MSAITGVLKTFHNRLGIERGFGNQNWSDLEVNETQKTLVSGLLFFCYLMDPRRFRISILGKILLGERR